jgi:nitrogen fixation protein NifU and related proteins
VSAYPRLVLEHFKTPRNRGPLAGADISIEGANPLCGDRVRIELRIADGIVADSRFTADACALCVASASLLTEQVRGMTTEHAGTLDDAFAVQLIGGEVAAARRRCVTLPLDTLRRGLQELALSKQ